MDTKSNAKLDYGEILCQLSFSAILNCRADDFMSELAACLIAVQQSLVNCTPDDSANITKSEVGNKFVLATLRGFLKVKNICPELDYTKYIKADMIPDDDESNENE